MRQTIRILALAGLIVAAAVGAALLPGSASSEPEKPGNDILARAIDIDLGKVKPEPTEQLVSSGVVVSALEALGEFENRGGGGAAGAGAGISRRGSEGCQNRFVDEASGRWNVRVNQDCSLRRQAEEVIAINPVNPQNMIAGQNDSRIGFNHCGYDWTFNGGRSWGDQVPPFWQFQLADGRTSDACSDPTATFDANANAYVGGILFNVEPQVDASAVVVAKSNAAIGGAFYHSPLVQPFQAYRTVPLGVVANDNNPSIMHDKEFAVGDNNFASPKANNVYTTWTRFAPGQSPIYFSQSTDGGDVVARHRDQRREPGPVHRRQRRRPVRRRPGLASDRGAQRDDLRRLREQQRSKHRRGAAADPVRQVSGERELRQSGQLVRAGQDRRPRCDPTDRTRLRRASERLPERSAVSPAERLSRRDRDLDLAVGRHQQPAVCGLVGFPQRRPPVYRQRDDSDAPCDNDVFYAYSTNGGASWSDPVQVTPEGNAQWQPWSDVAAHGRTLWIGYYDRSYGDCETEGCNDITLVGVTNPATSTPDVEHTRLTTDSMPNLVIANNPLQAGFLGDYMWVEADNGGRAHVVWADTRGLNGAVEEDIYYARHPQ
jgi:hypothetical protein